jgi:hypothetical protein
MYTRPFHYMNALLNTLAWFSFSLCALPQQRDAQTVVVTNGAIQASSCYFCTPAFLQRAAQLHKLPDAPLISYYTADSVC